MRCKNCGWDNEPGTLNCIKCNIPLEGTMGTGEDNSSKKPPSEVQKGIGGTIPATPVNLPAWDEPTALQKPESKIGEECPHCNYPLATVSTTCPNCHNPINEDGDKSGAKVTPGGSDIPTSGTIDPYRQINAEKFSLTPVPRANEGILPDINFHGALIELNRDNLEKGNTSITSKVQAVIKKINGEWHIVDKSELQTTFVRPSVLVKLRPGDIILLGDRKFIFKT